MKTALKVLTVFTIFKIETEYVNNVRHSEHSLKVSKVPGTGVSSNSGFYYKTVKKQLCLGAFEKLFVNRAQLSHSHLEKLEP